MAYSDSRLAVQEPAVDVGRVAFLAIVDGLESLVAASPINSAPDARGRANSFNQAPRQLGANRLLISKKCHRFPFKFHEIRGYHCYQNEYQTALDRSSPIPRKITEKTAKTGLKCPIPTSASKFLR